MRYMAVLATLAMAVMARGDCQRQVFGCVPYCPLTHEQRADPTHPCVLDARLKEQDVYHRYNRREDRMPPPPQDARPPPQFDHHLLAEINTGAGIAHFGAPHPFAVHPMLSTKDDGAALRRALAAMTSDASRPLKFPPRASFSWGAIIGIAIAALIWGSVIGLIILSMGK